VASEALLIKEPNITHVKVIQIEGSNRILLAICKLMVNDSPPASVKDAAASAASTTSTSSSSGGGGMPNSTGSDEDESPSCGSTGDSSPMISPRTHMLHTTTPQSPIPRPSMPPVTTICGATAVSGSQQPLKKYNISVVNLANGETVREIIYNGEILELKSNASLLIVNSWSRIDAFDLSTYEHRFTVTTCFSQVSKSTGRLINPIALGHRWLAFADTKVSYFFFNF
jgi:hypothetical protein